MKNYEAIEQLDKHRQQSQQCTEISQTSSPPDSWVSRVSCNSDKCFPWTDVKFQVHKLWKDCLSQYIWTLKYSLKWLTVSCLISFTFLSAVTCVITAQEEKILYGHVTDWFWLDIHDASFSHSVGAIQKINGMLWLQPALNKKTRL